MDMNSLLESLYDQETSSGSHEKTAEAAFSSGLKDSEENPFMSMSTKELMKLASDLEAEAPAEVEDTSEDLEKTAFDMLGGQIMAHSMVHEFGLMKEAMAAGICRVCKEHPMDVEGSSICSECLGS